MPDRGTDRVLVVEDDRAVTRVVSAALRNRGYSVHSATTGEAALVAAEKEGPDVVVLDLGLPDIDGIDVCRRLRAWSTVPIIVVTAEGADERKVLALDEGADDYVTKPFSIRELLARVRAILRRTDGTKRKLSRYKFSDVELDFETYRAKKNGEALDMSPREFELLRYLIERKGETVSRERLLEDVWGYESYPSTRTVDTHIAKLRAKIGDSGSEPRYILTIHGVGYKFVDPDNRGD